jgi:hypothetical protein
MLADNIPARFAKFGIYQMIEYRLGRSIGLLIPFYRRIKQKELITNKLLIVMAIVAIAKIAVFLLWPI